MSTELVVLAVVMFAATYPVRAVGLLMPGIDRLPRPMFDYLQLVGPAVLAALGAVAVMVVQPEGLDPALHVGIEWVAVAACVGLTAWRKNLLVGLVVAVGIVAVARMTGIAALPA